MPRLSGIATSSTVCSGSRSTPIATNTADQDDQPGDLALSDQRHHHFEDDRDQQPDRRAGHAGQDPPQRVDLTVTGIQRGKNDRDHHRRADQPGKGRDTAGNAAETRAEHDRQIDDVRTRQEMAQREGLVEFLRRHPAVLVDDAAPGPDQHPAEARQRHFGERHEQLEQTGRGWRRGQRNIRRRDGGGRGILRHGPKSRTAAGRRPIQSPYCPVGRSVLRPYFSPNLHPILGVPVRRLWK